MSIQNPQLQLALQHHQNQNFEEAEKVYQSIIENNQLDTRVYPNLVDVFNQQGKFEASITLLTSGIEKVPTDPQIRILLSQTYLHIGLIGEAEKVIDQTLEKFPLFAAAHNFKGNIFIQQRKLDEALQSFEKAVSLMPDLAEGYYNIGMIHFEKGDTKKAKENWKKALEIQPQLYQAYLNLGNQAINEGLYDEAIEYLGQVLKIDPNHFSALKMLGMAKHSRGYIQEALDIYLKLHSEEKPNEDILILLGNANRDLDKLKEAESFYAKALKINPSNRIAKENLQKLTGDKINSWHLNMLSDLKRNEGYDEAIKRVVKKEDIVLDIGTGSGLLSMMCARAGAKKVYTCETIEAIAETAKKIISDNQLDDTIVVFHAKSTALTVGKELPQKVDVLVSEILDCGLLGEGVLPSLRDAKVNLLKQDAKIIPAAATVMGFVIESDPLRSVNTLDNISGFDLSEFNKFKASLGYSQFNLNCTPHEKLSKPTKLIGIDFYNLPPQSTDENPNNSIFELKVEKSGRIDALVFWFDLHLDEQLSLSSGPEGEMFHWGQANFTFPEPKEVKKGDLIKINIHQSETKFLFSYA